MNYKMVRKMLELNFFMLEVNVTNDVRRLIVKESEHLRDLSLRINGNMYLDWSSI